MGKRVQRIPSWPGVIHSNKGRIHLRRPTCDILTFRLRRSGGPYIPIDVEKSASHQLSQLEIASDNPYRHLSEMHSVSGSPKALLCTDRILLAVHTLSQKGLAARLLKD